MKGFIILPRDFASDECFRTGEPFDRSRAFLDLVMHASHKERTLTIRNTETHLEPGEMVTSLRTLCRRWHRSLGYVTKTLRSFSYDGLIIRKADTGITVIKIADWQKYQGYSCRTPAPPETEKDAKRDTEIKQNIPAPVSLKNEQKTKEIIPLQTACGHPADTVFKTAESRNRDNLQKCSLGENKYASDEASSLAAFFLSEILRNNPYMMPPKKYQWDIDIGRLIVDGNVPPGVLRRMIEYSQRNPGWSRLIVSPYKLKVHFHKIFLDMNMNEKKNNKTIPTAWRPLT